jgi:uncharacterized membrane protein
MSNQLLVFLFAIIPTFEARYSILAGLLKFNMSPLEAFVFAALGTFTATLLMIFGLFYLLPKLNIKFINKITNKIFEHTKKKHSKTIENMASIGVISFIAVPLPGTGIYGGSIVCYLMGYSARKTLLLCTIGMLISTSIVLITTVGVESIIKVAS